MRNALGGSETDPVEESGEAVKAAEDAKEYSGGGGAATGKAGAGDVLFRISVSVPCLLRGAPS